MKKTIFVQGASDLEMSTIERILLSTGKHFTHATDKEGRRVRPEGANRGVVPASLFQGMERVVMIECRVEVPAGVEVIVVDHHAPGDPGYGLPPEQFWEASSIGQICSLLGLLPNSELLLVAAGDHCPGHAYRGRCPGVDPKELLEFRAKEKAQFQRKPVEQVIREITDSVTALADLHKLDVGGHLFTDVRGLDLPQLPEASAVAGTAVLYRLEEVGRPIKVGVLNGAPEEIRAFMENAENIFGLSRIYGDPARGYAGGYE